MRVKKYATNELTASAARRFQQFRGRKSNVASTKPKLNYLFLSSINLVFVIAIGIWMTASMAVRPQASQRCDKLSPDFFSCLFCRCAALRTKCCRTCDKCSQFRTLIIIIFLRRLCFRWRENGKQETGGKKLYDGEPHTMETKIDLLKEFVWTRRTTNMKWKLRGCASRKPKIEFRDVISVNEEKRRKAITAMSRRERRRANIANILFSGRCIATCQ